MGTYPRHLLVANLPAGWAEFRSFRTGFACAFPAAKCPNGIVQALVRWRSGESVDTYAWLDPGNQTTWVAKVLQ